MWKIQAFWEMNCLYYNFLWSGADGRSWLQSMILCRFPTNLANVSFFSNWIPVIPATNKRLTTRRRPKKEKRRCRNNLLHILWLSAATFYKRVKGHSGRFLPDKKQTNKKVHVFCSTRSPWTQHKRCYFRWPRVKLISLHSVSQWSELFSQTLHLDLNSLTLDRLTFYAK